MPFPVTELLREREHEEPGRKRGREHHARQAAGHTKRPHERRLFHAKDDERDELERERRPVEEQIDLHDRKAQQSTRGSPSPSRSIEPNSPPRQSTALSIAGEVIPCSRAASWARSRSRNDAITRFPPVS